MALGPSADLGAASTSASSYPDDGALSKWTGRRDGSCSNYDWGYKNSSGTWKLNSSRGFAFRNCTDFVAWKLGLTWSSFKFAAGKGNAIDWKGYAKNAGFTVASKASVGDIAWWGTSRGG